MKIDFISNQRGASLIEALVSVLVVAIMGLGVVYAVSQILLNQRYATTQNFAVVHIREHLQRSESSTESFILAGETVELEVEAVQEDITISLLTGDGTDLPMTVANVTTGIQVTAENDELFGEGGRIVLSHGAAPQAGTP